MKVDNIKYKYILELVENHLNRAPDHTFPGKQGQVKSGNKVPEISAEVIRLLSSLSPEERKTLVSIWLKLNLPFEAKSLNELLTLLKNASSKEEALSRIKAFALICKNQLPRLPHMILGLSHYIRPGSILTDELNHLLFPEGNQSNTEDNSADSNKTVQTILDKITIDISRDSEMITEKLKNYTNRIQESLEILQNSPEKEQRLLNQLLGQQLINNHRQELLLALELPFFIPEYNKLFPAYLRVLRERDQKKEADSNSNKNIFKVAFIISLEKMGFIRADAVCKNLEKGIPTINIVFRCSLESTIEIVREKKTYLIKALKKLGYIVEQAEIKLEKKTEKEELEDFFEGLTEITNYNDDEQFHHINFRI
ncbi:MAG TPA: hypothetical protein VKY40_05715 [Halanaerobiales bacterium]|nr:hypothetical protein [Halanaerobiales bacterium]